MQRMAERRAHPRKKIVLPVKVLLGSATLLTHTIDITCSGARLGGLHTELQPGQTVVLHRGTKKARFRVVWVERMTAKELHVGVECLEPQSGFLGVDLSEQEREGEKSFQTLMTLLSKNSKPAEPRH
jgi:PilZ domain